MQPIDLVARILVCAVLTGFSFASDIGPALGVSSKSARRSSLCINLRAGVIGRTMTDGSDQRVRSATGMVWNVTSVAFSLRMQWGSISK